MRTEKGEISIISGSIINHVSLILNAEVYARVLEIGAQFLSPLVQNLLKLSLSLHTYSPAVETYNQVCVCRIVCMCV